MEGITYINDSKATNVNSVFFAFGHNENARSVDCRWCGQRE
ncbi:hypothetical protein CCAN12_810087 [Capnocytophaga canimorsus]|uniref:Uncharacterized protein n=1 Tax=Capnocytophaga canimorsus TaxID=28188 RepID=A0A0B7HUE3_9FLAO|nr:hypothetical protein CCAN12_810087 [Capnocytophaga canimorsus]